MCFSSKTFYALFYAVYFVGTYEHMKAPLSSHGIYWSVYQGKNEDF